MEKQDVVIEKGMHSPGDTPGKESTCNAGDPGSIPGSGRFPWRKNRLSTPGILGFPGSSDGKESACNVGDLGSIPGLGRSPRDGNDSLLQYSCLEHPEEPGRMQFMASLRVRHDGATKHSTAQRMECYSVIKKNEIMSFVAT